jgi:putative heme-binding domain-containing protein
MIRLIALLAALSVCTSIATAQDPTVAPLLKLLKSGRLPKERQPQVVERVCSRGGPEELAFVLEQALQPEEFSPELRVKSLAWLAEAAETRKVRPAGELGGIAALIQPEAKGTNADLSLAAIRLVSVWQVAAAAPRLATIAESPKSPPRLRKAAIEGLGRLGGDDTRKVLEQLAGKNPDLTTRMLAVGSLARVDAEAAAKTAASVLSEATPETDSGPMLSEFFVLKDGPALLAKALEHTKLQPDVAKRALRYMYSVGHSDADLSQALSEMAGIATDVPPPTPDEALKIAAEVSTRGDAARGEQIFRRDDVSCLKCHAIHRAGGQVGPDLSNVGRISPVDYIVNSILNPNLAIKEAYVTRIVETSDGKLVQGIAIDRDADRLLLRTADGKAVAVPTADIESEEEGRSLMPQGLTKFLTQQEFYDLAKFVSELGKEGGGYTAPAEPTVQRWRVLAEPSAELVSAVPNVEQVRVELLDAPPDAWRPAYAMASGELPLAEQSKDRDDQPLYLLAEFDVVVEGEVTVRLDSTATLSAWLDATPLETKQPFTTALTAGHHKLVVRVDSPRKPEARLKAVVTRPSGSSAQVDIVAGQ